VASLALGLLATRQARGIPAFGRKYGTSCMTCHTVYPKLTPFGEAFRRNGYRFPGIDSDYWKQATIPLGHEESIKEFPNTVWPGSLPADVPLALGFNGQAVVHPDRSAAAAQADNGARLTLQDLVEEGHLWAGGSFDDKITFFGEITVSQDGAEIEHAFVSFNDLFGPRRAANLAVGRIVPTLSSYGIHSSYLSDLAMPSLPVTALYGATTDSWALVAGSNGIEMNGVLAGRFDYSAGTNAGANVGAQETENYYVHAGYKVGGMRLDGEQSSAPANPHKPWQERAVTLDAFFYRSASHFLDAGGDLFDDHVPAFGAALRGQWDSFEYSGGVFHEEHDHAGPNGGGLVAVGQYDELSFVCYPWLVPAVRVDYLWLRPTSARAVTDLRVTAGAAALARPNLRLWVLVAVERSGGAPSAGWAAAGGFTTPPRPGAIVGPQVEGVMVGLAYAF
jgi:hypothetical protein